MEMREAMYAIIIGYNVAKYANNNRVPMQPSKNTKGLIYKIDMFLLVKTMIT